MATPLAPSTTAPTRHPRRWQTWAQRALLATTLVGAANLADAMRREHVFQSIGSEHGLAQNTVNALLQDKQGFIWVATEGGLHRFDGDRFQIYQHRPDDASSLPESVVTALAQDDQGRLWVGSNSHYVAAFSPTSGRVLVQPERGTPGERRNHVSALLFESGRGLWIGTAAGVELYLPDSDERREIIRFDTGSPKNPRSNDLALDAQGWIWAATDAGLFRIDPQTLEPERLDSIPSAFALYRDSEQTLWIGASRGLFQIDQGNAVQRWPEAGSAAAGTSVRALAADREGKLWLAMWHKGLVRFDPRGGDAETIPYVPDMPASLPEESLTELMLDRSGLLWLGGEARGLATTQPAGAPFVYIADLAPTENRIATNNIRVFHQTADGALWLGTEGDGIKRYDLQTHQFSSHTVALQRELDAAQRNDIRVLGIDDADAGRLWVSSNRGLFLLDPRAQTAERVTLAPPGSGMTGVDTYQRAMRRGRDGSLWIGTFNAGLVRYFPDGSPTRFYRHDSTGEDALSNPLVNNVFEDASGRIWVGTLNGLNLIDPASGRVRQFRNDASDPLSLSGNLVRSVHQGADGTLWVGTHSGLNRIEESVDGGFRFHRIGLAQGLPNPTVYAIAEDPSGRLWLSSNNGIASFDPGSGAFQRFGLRDGLQDLAFNGDAHLQLKDGRIAFGGIRGFNLLDPAAVRHSSYSPRLAFTALRAGNSPLELPDDADGDGKGIGPIRIEQSVRVLRFEFTALDFAAPERNRYAYRLEGFDADWIEAGSRADATYTNLDPGNYVFRARGTNHDGIWSEHELSLPIVISPPWWNSGIAHALYALSALALLLVLVYWQRLRRSQEQSLLQQITDREERLKLSLWGSGDEFWDWDVRANTLFRLGADQLLGLRREHEVTTEDWRSRAVHPDDLSRVQEILQQHIVGDTEFFESEHRIRNAHNEWIWVRSRGKVVARDPAGNPLRIAGTARDISLSRQADRDRRIASEVLRSMGEAVAVCDLEFRFVSVNPAFSRITGYSEEEVAGQPSGLLNSPQHSDDFYRRLREAVVQYGHWKGEMWQRRKDGEEFLGWIELSEVCDMLGARSHYVAVVNDVTDKKRAEQELRYLANYDTLTGLPNRSLLSERLARAVVRARRQDARVAVLFLDLDRFKDINDSLGHAAGDRILKAAAARLLGIVRETDTVARLGGDEFTVVVEDIADVAAAEQMAEKILQCFVEPLEIDGRSEVAISPSIGISLYPDHGLVPTDLLKYADTAMYQAKDRGRNTYQFYTEAMDAEARRRAIMVASLRRALERGEFRLVYQPRLSLLDGRISGVEALLRWHCEELGEVPPTTFIPLAEETGLILPIGEWVLREACMTLQRWRRQGLTEIGMAVNVSVLQLLRGRMPETLRRILDDIDVPAERIELEVTESMVMANAEQTNLVLRELKAIGATIAIDDFGTGYSSLIYLKRLPIDTLKIDKEFVGDITNDPDDEAITATVITMAHSLGLNVVAEGVETEEQLLYLREQGCDEIQGYWLSPPIDVHHCVAFIRAYRPQPQYNLGNVDAGPG